MLTVREHSDLVGVAPLYIHSDQTDGIRQLTLLGNGITDCCDILLDGQVTGADQAVMDRLLDLMDSWTTYDFRDVPATSALIAMMRTRFRGWVSEDSPCVAIDLDSWTGKGSGAPAKVLAELRRRRRRAEELGKIRIKAAGSDNLAHALDELFRLHRYRWRARGMDGVLSEDAVEAFHREIAERFARQHWLRLYCLYLEDRMIAANYGFSLRQHAYSYIGGFDPEFVSLGPAAMVIHHGIQAAAQEGAVDFDFLRGPEPYKYRWGGKSRPQYRIVPLDAAGH
jgi:hypothetical protein